MFIMFDITSVVSVLFLVFLEGMLSMDNALVLALTVKHLPALEQKKALTYGIFGAFAFRFLALVFLTTLIKLTWLKVAAAVYLLYLGIAHFLLPQSTEMGKKWVTKGFWTTVVMVEVLDIAFSMDSIFAGVATSARFSVIFLGGVMGIVMMRFAANVFIKLIERFSWLEKLAYVLIMLIGAKLGIQALL